MILNWANRITILRILLIVPFVICMLKMNSSNVSQLQSDLLRYAGIFIFAIMAASDGVDGYLARRKGQITKLGSFLDPTADKLLMTCACLLLASKSGGVEGFLLDPAVVILIIGKDVFLLLGFLIIFFLTFEVRIVPVFVGKLSTILQLAMVAGILIAPEISRFIDGWLIFLKILWWSAAITAIFTTLIYIRNGSRYIDEHDQSSGTNK
ncbi:MAG: CDP-alcohol phosphatidyltransferase family protein [Planctomycetes bacterium]|nr:CDP-alcohol phosphatidyltransferase family protein [Planctomycetota bacterium]